MRSCICSFLTLLVCATVSAQSPRPYDWPQWQGRNRDAMSEEKGLLQAWPSSGPPLAWKITGLGGGYSAPAVAAGRLIGLSTRAEDEVVWALSETDGATLWTTRLGPASKAGGRQGIEGPGSTPTVDGDHLYVIGASGVVACLQVSDGKIVWQRHLIDDFGGKLPKWRYSESPLIDGEKLICTPGAPDATMVALNKLTGELIWKSLLTEEEASGAPKEQRGGRDRGPGSGAGYASAIAIDFENQHQYVQLTAKALVGVSATDGKVLWTYARPANTPGINCSTPVYHDGQIFASSAYGTGGGLVKLSKSESGDTEAKEVYFTTKMQNHHGGMIYFDGCLYGAAGGNGGGFLVCIDFQTGEVLWSKREAPKGALAMADGRLYMLTEDGTLLLIEPNRKEYIERGRFEHSDRSSSPDWTHPVIANGKLYIRDQDVLLCYDVKAM